MEKTRENYYLENIIQFVIMLCLVLVPIFFSTNIHNAFTIEKNTIFRICTLLAGGLSLINLVYYPRRNNIPVLFWLVPGFWAVGLLSTIFSLEPLLSTWGIHLRMDGLVNLTFLVVWFVLLYLNANNWLKLKRLIWVIGLTSIIPVGYALMQKFGLDPIDWKSVVESERVFGTTGNPAYLGAYLMFVMPVTFYLAWVSRGLKKYGLGLLFVLQILVLLFTLTRAAYLGLAVEGLVIGVVYFMVAGKKPLALGILGIFIVLALGIGVLNVKPELTQYFGDNRYIVRLSQLAQTTEGTGRDRLEMWKIAAKAIAERPVLGSGLATYAHYFSQHYPNYMDARPVSDRYSNYSHNYWLDNGVAFGLAGLIFLISIYVSFTLAGYKKSIEEENPEKKLLYVALFVAIWGYLTQATFNIETVITWLYAYSFLALLLAAIYQTGGEPEHLEYHPSIIKQAGVTLAGLAMLVGVWYLGINPARADAIYFVLEQKAPNLSATERLSLAEMAKNLTPYYEFSYMKLADAYIAQIDLVNRPGEAPAFFQKTVEQIEQALAIDPLNYKNFMFMGQVYGNWAKIDQAKISPADDFFQQAKDVGPNRLEIEWQWGNIYYDMNNYPEAERHYQIAKDLNDTIGETYFYLARGAFMQGNETKGDEYLKTASQLGYSCNQAALFNDMSLKAYQNGQSELAGKLAVRANAIAPQDHSAMIEVQTLLESGQTVAARAKLEEFKKILPGLEKYNI